MFKNVASQKVTLLAIDTAANVPKTGDAANLTAYVSIDDGAVTVLGDTSATELSSTNAPGLYSFDLTQAETNGDKLVFSAKSSTADIRVVPAMVYTFPATGILAPTTAGRTLTVESDGMAHADLKEWLGTAPAAYSTTRGTAGTALPNAAADAAGGLIISDAGGFDIDNRAPAAAAVTNLNTVFNTDFASAYDATNNMFYTNTLFWSGVSTSSGQLAVKTTLDVIDAFADDVGTAQAGAAGTITLRSGAVATDDYYNGAVVNIYGGTGAGQSRRITDYNGTTKVATVDSNWATNPDNTSTYFVIGRIV